MKLLVKSNSEEREQAWCVLDYYNEMSIYSTEFFSFVEFYCLGLFFFRNPTSDTTKPGSQLSEKDAVLEAWRWLFLGFIKVTDPPLILFPLSYASVSYSLVSRVREAMSKRLAEP